MDKPSMILYYLSYPLRVLGIFFTGLFFAGITSPAEFLRWGSIGLKIALLYRAFEYSITSFEENRIALTIQGSWPDSDSKNKFKALFKVIKVSSLLIAITFRNIILWFPWAWLCYTNLKKDLLRKR